MALLFISTIAFVIWNYYRNLSHYCSDVNYNNVYIVSALNQIELKKALGDEYNADGDYISCVFDIKTNGKKYIRVSNLEQSGVNNRRDYLFEKNSLVGSYKRIKLSFENKDYNIDNILLSYNNKELIILRHFWGGAADNYNYLNVYKIDNNKVDKYLY